VATRLEAIPVANLITAAPAGSAACEDAMRRRDFLKTAMAGAVLTAPPPVHAGEARVASSARFADVNGQHVFYAVHGSGKPLILIHGGIDPDSFGSNLAELARGTTGDRPASAGPWAHAGHQPATGQRSDGRRHRRPLALRCPRCRAPLVRSIRRPVRNP
jgi:hypothetical protein